MMEYPEETEGSKLARKARERCNSLSDEERKKYHEAGMKTIYKGRTKRKKRLYRERVGIPLTKSK